MRKTIMTRSKSAWLAMWVVAIVAIAITVGVALPGCAQKSKLTPQQHAQALPHAHEPEACSSFEGGQIEPVAGILDSEMDTVRGAVHVHACRFGVTVLRDIRQALFGDAEQTQRDIRRQRRR